MLHTALWANRVPLTYAEEMRCLAAGAVNYPMGRAGPPVPAITKTIDPLSAGVVYVCRWPDRWLICRTLRDAITNYTRRVSSAEPRNAPVAVQWWEQAGDQWHGSIIMVEVTGWDQATLQPLRYRRTYSRQQARSLGVSEMLEQALLGAYKAYGARARWIWQKRQERQTKRIGA